MERTAGWFLLQVCCMCGILVGDDGLEIGRGRGAECCLMYKKGLSFAVLGREYTTGTKG